MRFRLPGRRSLRVSAEADKETEIGAEAKPQEAGGNFYNDERPVSLICLALLCYALACHAAKEPSRQVLVECLYICS